MSNIEEKFKLYRERACNIENKNIEIENLKIDGFNDEDKIIKQLKLDIKKMQLENKKIDNILRLLSDKEYRVVKLIHIEGKDKKRVAKDLDRTERQINRILDKSIKKIIWDI